MKIAVSEAEGQLPDLVRRAEAGDDIVLTLEGRPSVRLVPVERPVDRARRRAALHETLARARARQPDGGPSAARSQDWLYDDDGLPA